MRPQLRALAAVQGGLITRQQAIRSGYSETEIRRLTRTGGPWVLVRRGAYAERSVFEAAHDRNARLLLRDWAAHLTMTRPHLVSHDSAVRAHDLPMLHPEMDLVHVTRFGVGGSRTHEGVKHHLTRVGLLDAPQVGDMRLTGLARTAVDMAREHGWLAGLVVCDAVLQRGLTPARLEEELSLMWCWPDVTQARSAVAQCAFGAESVGETLSRVRIEELGLGRPETQFPVLAGGRTFWVDLRLGRLLIEFDGRRKYERLVHGGLADREVSTVIWEERQREQLICRRGWGMCRLTWDDVFGAGWDRARARVLSDVEETRARFGDEVPAPAVQLAAEARARRTRGRLAP